MAYVKQTWVNEKTVLTAEHMEHIEDGISNIAFDDLKNRPFGDIVYNDVCEFSTVGDVYFDALGERWYKVSDLVLTYEEQLKAVYSLTNGDETVSVTPTAEDYLVNEEPITGFNANPMGVVTAYKSGLVETSLATVTIPETGTYLAAPTDLSSYSGAVFKISCEYLKQIDEKYLPEIDALPEVTTDDNGKVLKVANGEWTLEQDEVGSGGGSSATEYTVTKLTLNTSDTRIYDGASSCFLNIGSNDMITVGCMFKTSSAITVSEPGNTNFSFEATVSDEVKSRVSSLLGKKLDFTQRFMNAAYGGTDKGNLFWIKISLNASKVVMQIFPIKSLVAEESGRAIYSF